MLGGWGGRVCAVGWDVCCLDTALGRLSKSNLLRTSPNQPLSITSGPAAEWVNLENCHGRSSAGAAKRPSINIQKLTACCRASFNWQIQNDILCSVSFFNLPANEKCTNPGKGRDFGNYLGSSQFYLSSTVPIQELILYIIIIYICIHTRRFIHSLSA